MFEVLRPYLISFAIGLVIGIERERSHPAGVQTSGVRTLILFALLGTFAADIKSVPITIALSLFVFGAILLGYFRSTEPKERKKFIGLTTELTAGAVFCLGYVAAERPLLACIIALAVLLVLLGREQLHVFAREKLKLNEIQATVTILVISLTVLSFLPNRTIDPWNLFNPRRFGFLVMILAIIQFGGYVAIRVFGERLGTMMTGFFGGLISSTVVYATLPRFSKQHPKLLYPIVAAAIFAVLGMLLEFIVIVFVAAPQLIASMIWPLMTMLAVGTMSSLLVVRRARNGSIITPIPTNPLDVKSVLRLALFIGGMLIVIAVAKQYVGVEGVKLVNFFGGLFELHSVSLATATLFSEKKLTLQVASQSLALALLATYVSKFILLWSLARNRFAVITTLFLLGMLLSGAIVFFLTV